MREHILNIQLKVTARDWIGRADLIADLREQLEALHEEPPYRHVTGGGWWTDNAGAVVALNPRVCTPRQWEDYQAGNAARSQLREAGIDVTPRCRLSIPQILALSDLVESFGEEENSGHRAGN